MPEETTHTIVPVPAELVVRDPEKLRWGTVSTIRAPLRDIARFAAFHLDLGAAEVNIFLDEPSQETADFFAAHPAVRITQCDDDYWANKPEKARSTHQLRQAYNASACYRHSNLDWLAHIDVDEFILAPRGLARLLAETPDDAAYARMHSAEMLSQPAPWHGPSYFKLTRREAIVAKSEIYQIYPEFGQHVPQGFVSHVGGKVIARTGLPKIRLGIHSLKQNGARVSNGHYLAQTHIGHAHAPSWEVFRAHRTFRMTRGSYRRKPHETIKLADILELIHAEEGNSGLHRFFDELCQASPSLLEKLARRDMLLTARLDTDEKTARWFGELPANEDQQ